MENDYDLGYLYKELCDNLNEATERNFLGCSIIRYTCNITKSSCVGVERNLWEFGSQSLDPKIIERCPAKDIHIQDIKIKSRED